MAYLQPTQFEYLGSSVQIEQKTAIGITSHVSRPKQLLVLLSIQPLNVICKDNLHLVQLLKLHNQCKSLFRCLPVNVDTALFTMDIIPGSKLQLSSHNWAITTRTSS